MEYDSFVTHSIDMYMGKPKSGKTLIAASYPKPLLYVSIGNDGGGRVIMTKYRSDVEKGLIKVINLRNDPSIGGKIRKTSCEKLAELLAELRKPDADKFKTIVIDTFAALQDDYKVWGDVAKMVLNLKDNMKRFSEEQHVTFVWITHTSEQELTETSGLNKEIRIVPDLTIKTGIKCMKDASNIFYCCRKTCLNDKGEKEVKFLTYVGPHPLMDTGTRDMLLKTGEFVEDFNYDKWQALIKAGVLDETKVLTPEVDTIAETKDVETSDEN